MRRLCLTLLCGLVAVPAALAASYATGDGVLELSNVTGNVAVTGSRGTVWGQMSKGKLVVTDPVAGDGVIYVSGAEGVPGKADNVTIYQRPGVRKVNHVRRCLRIVWKLYPVSPTKRGDSKAYSGYAKK